MTPEELAAIHPELFHVTGRGSWETIARLGLLSTRAAVELFSPPDHVRRAALRHRRAKSITLSHETHGTLTLNDQLPLSEKALRSCLDDGLEPRDWLSILNERVFFWADRSGLGRMLNARMNRDRSRDILVFDTLALAKAHADCMELCPINSGSTIRRPARRGKATFTPLLRHGYAEWRQLRGRRDHILEIAVRYVVRDPARYLQSIEEHNGHQASE